MTNDLPDALIEKVARAMRKALEETFADTDNSDCFKDRALPSTKSAWMDIASKTALSIIQPELDKRDAVLDKILHRISQWQEDSSILGDIYNDITALKTTTGHDSNGGGV